MEKSFCFNVGRSKASISPFVLFRVRVIKLYKTPHFRWHRYLCWWSI